MLAHVPERVPDEVNLDAIAQLRQEISHIKQQFGGNELPKPVDPLRPLDALTGLQEPTISHDRALAWRVKSILEESGIYPVHAESIMDDLTAVFGERPPDSLAKQLDLAWGALARRWKRPASLSQGGVHVFVGAPGVGKTTCLCKWLAQSVFLNGTSAEVLRLDSSVANTAESLSIYCDILGVPSARFLDTGIQESMRVPEKKYFVDFPGVNPSDPAALKELIQRIRDLPGSVVHLVLNAAYDTRLLLAQVRAFEVLGFDDLIVTHLDEEQRWGKLWNLSLGTNYAIRFLNSGQNVPGEFIEASPERILSNQFRRNR